MRGGPAGRSTAGPNHTSWRPSQGVMHAAFAQPAQKTETLGEGSGNFWKLSTVVLGKRRTTSIFPVILLERRSSGDLYLSKRISRRVGLGQDRAARPTGVCAPQSGGRATISDFLSMVRVQARPPRRRQPPLRLVKRLKSSQATTRAARPSAGPRSKQPLPAHQIWCRELAPTSSGSWRSHRRL